MHKTGCSVDTQSYPPLPKNMMSNLQKCGPRAACLRPLLLILFLQCNGFQPFMVRETQDCFVLNLFILTQLFGPLYPIAFYKTIVHFQGATNG